MSLLTTTIATGAADDNPLDPTVIFELVAIDNEPILYPVISPTDGDILDRGLHTRTVTFTFHADRGELVVCTDRNGLVLDQARLMSCGKGDELFCFESRVDSRLLPNGPNRLLFRLYDSAEPMGKASRLLAERSVVVHVLNARLEVERSEAGAVLLRLQAGTLDPRDVKGYRFAIFAAQSRTPSSTQLPEYEGLRLPIGGPGRKDPAPLRLFPSDGTPSAEWPEGRPFLHFQVSWAELGRVRPFDPQTNEILSNVVFLTAAIHDGTRWEWSSITSVLLAKTPTAK